MPMSRYMFLRLFPSAGAQADLADTEVAVGDERAHPEPLGEYQRLTILALSMLRGVAAGGEPRSQRAPAS